ncbi:MAG TPA: TadE family protein, partial [Vicinamibacterales bacterium]|nr:TadE family protein [Vicinamibacterales bacterium]
RALGRRRAMRHSHNNERGAALVEAAVTIPILLLIAVGIFEFGRAYQTWQVLTNAAREGARYAVTPSSTTENTVAIVRDYMRGGGLPDWETAAVNVTTDVPMNPGTGTRVTIRYPFSFIVLQPVARLVVPASRAGEAITMSATALMRNEAGS